MEKQKPTIQKSLENLIQAMKKTGYSRYMITRLKNRVAELKNSSVFGIERFVKKLSERLGNREAYLDILMEGRFAVILARNGFSEIQLEYCEKGPDMRAVYNGEAVYFEVTRRRPTGDEWAERTDATFAPQDSIENVIGRVQAKARQLEHDQVNVVVLWSDTIRVLTPEVKEAFGYIRQELRENLGNYKDLSAVLFTEGGGVDATTLKQFHLFRNDMATRPLSNSLADKLESLHEEDPKKWQRDIDEMYRALKRVADQQNDK
jgi:hypothetical protein